MVFKNSCLEFLSSHRIQVFTLSSSVWSREKRTEEASHTNIHNMFRYSISPFYVDQIKGQSTPVFCIQPWPNQLAIPRYLSDALGRMWQFHLAFKIVDDLLPMIFPIPFQRQLRQWFFPCLLSLNHTCYLCICENELSFSLSWAYCQFSHLAIDT